MDKCEELLTKEIERTIETMSMVGSDTDEYKAICTNLNTLYKLRTDEKKIASEREKLELERNKLNHEKERDSKKQALDEAKAQHEYEISNDKLNHERVVSEREMLEAITARMWQSGIRIAEIAIPAVIYWVLMNRGFEFERDGCITSTFFRSLIGKTKPDKK